MVMVSLNPHQTIQDLFIDTGVNSMSTSSNKPSTMATAVNSDSNSTVVWPSDDTNKKVRKPYTITKSRESWTDEEHDKFLEALQLFDRDWKKIEAFVGSKTVIQIRSHAQKYFLKVQKSGTGEHVPPPRPKRKAAHPYPQKASKNAPTMPQVTQPFQSFGALVEAGYIFSPDSASLPGNAICNPHVPYWTGNTMSPANMSTVIKDEMGVTRQNMIHNCCSSSSNESTQRRRPTGETNDQGKENVLIPERVMPDFSQVYSFIGSVFDPNASGHLQKLKKMDPINVETVLLLMKNLTVNLLNPEFEDHRKMICSYGDDAEKIKPSSFPHISKPENAIPSV